GVDGCGDVSFRCSNGTCSIECRDTPASCEGTEVECGGGACTATCAGGSTPDLSGCDGSCSCTTCDDTGSGGGGGAG
ncbi:MAG TPA: hypothetical protein VF103_16055, partial [Polyangiaceae bacterium]